MGSFEAPSQLPRPILFLEMYKRYANVLCKAPWRLSASSEKEMESALFASDAVDLQDGTKTVTGQERRTPSRQPSALRSVSQQNPFKPAAPLKQALKALYFGVYEVEDSGTLKERWKQPLKLVG